MAIRWAATTFARAVVVKNTKNVMENNIPRVGKYRHYKGKEYEVIGIAKHSETLEEMVVYKALYGDGQIWVRPIQMFFEEVEVDGKKTLRFSPIEK
jgi:cyclomaltodextrinase / maltogenic alpha-amylase / neopullulanase